jgi:DNA end-binding protein Ku
MMAKAIWNGVISFGLLNIPVALRSAERSTDLQFRMLDSRDNSPIHFERVNAETGEEVPWKDVVKAFEYEKGNYVVLKPEDIKAVAPDLVETVEIESCVDRESIDPRYYEKPYYLVPAKEAEKGYVLLREALRKTNRIGIGKVVIRTREYLCGLLPVEDALVMLLLRFPQEIVSLDELELPRGSLAQYRISSKEVAMAEQLVESMTTDFDPSAYVDDFRKRLHEVIDTRIRAQKGTVTAAEPESQEMPKRATTNVVDFMSLLKKSLEGKRKESTGGRGTGEKDTGTSARAANSKTAQADERASRSGSRKSRTAAGKAAGSPAKKPAKKSASQSGARSGGKTAAGRQTARKRAA